MARPLLAILFLLLGCKFSVYGQKDSNTVVTFDFNEHDFNESESRTQTRGVSVSLVKDRFGNERSALYLHGHHYSYFSLGTSDLLKPEKGTISLWVNFERVIFAGKGYRCNPVIQTKNSANDDFNDAWTLNYELDTKRIMVISSKDSTETAAVNSIDTTTFNKWQHVVFTFGNNHLALYIDGVLQESAVKKYTTVYLQSDSVVVGNTANWKNDRYMRGMVDDIKIFHRVLSEKEINELYHAPNPNRAANIKALALKIAGIIAAILLCSYLLVWQRRRALKKEKEKFEIMNRMHELEIRTLKAQMNPHFIFNSLNTIRQLIMLHENLNAEIYLTKFSKLIRQLLESNANESLSLLDELEILKGYMEMESLRFTKQFEYSVETDDKLDADNTFIPHLMVQPFVENAIWHGLLPKEADRKLTVKFELKDEKTVLCTIDDNGVGREANKNKTDTFKKRSLALTYVNHRLELMSKILNTVYEVKITDKYHADGKPAGTTVVVTLPVIKDKNYAKSSYN
jgi:two-component sensor histidine kinase